VTAGGPGATAGLGWLVDDSVDRWNHQCESDQAEMLLLMCELLAMSRDPFY
jgi:hypothetical protein